MSDSLTPFRKIQIGKETTKGTAVPATRMLLGDWDFTEENERYMSEYPRGVLATIGGAGTITKRSTGVSISTELTFEEILWPLLTGIKGGTTPVAGVTTAQTWTFAPQLTTDPTIDTATVEVIESDGTTNHMTREMSYVMSDTFGLEVTASEVATLNWAMFGRASQSTTPTPALTPYTSREIALSARTSVYMDAAYADIGDTQLSGVLRSASLEFTTPFIPDYKLDGRDDLDFTKHTAGRGFAATASIQMQLDATAGGVITNWRDNDLRYMRFLIEGSEAETGVNKSIQVDGAFRFTGNPSYEDSDGVRLVSFDMEAVYDETASKIFEIVVVNTLATV